MGAAAGLVVLITAVIIVTRSSGPSRSTSAARQVLLTYLHRAGSGDVAGACRLVSDDSYLRARSGPYGSCENFIAEKMSSSSSGEQSLAQARVFQVQLRDANEATATWGVSTPVDTAVLTWDGKEGWRVDID